jgi:glycosyltransferase involved in cell wall biosynthesis
MMIGPYPRSPDRIDGGVAAAMTYLSQALVATQGIQLIGVRIAWNGEGSWQFDEFGWPIVDLSLGRLGLSTLYRRQKARLRHLISQYRPDIIHGQGVDVAGYLSVNSGMPSIVTVHGLLSENAKFQTGLAARARATVAGILTERQTIRRATDLIAISPFVTQYYGSQISGRVHEVPNAISPRYFGLKRFPERGRYLFAGRIANGKGLFDLLRAIVGNASTVTKVVLAGAAPDKSYENEVRMEAERLGLSGVVLFAGLLNEEELLAEFSRAEALLLPSHQETAPMVIQQAMAAGLAVIASKVGGIPYQLQHDATGLLFEPGNVDELTGLLRRLASDSSLGSRLGTAARVFASARYDANEIARATVSVYESVLSSNDRPDGHRKLQ